MSPAPGSPELVKGAFVHVPAPGAAPVVVVFPYNPETLRRTLQPENLGPASINSVPGNPQETIVFTLAIDSESVPPRVGVPPAPPFAVYPVLSALELLMYPAANATGSVTLFVWGPSRIVPIRITSLQISEELYDPELAPLRATVQVTLVVAPVDVAGTTYLRQHISTLETLAASAYSASLAPLGVSSL